MTYYEAGEFLPDLVKKNLKKQLQKNFTPVVFWNTPSLSFRQKAKLFFIKSIFTHFSIAAERKNHITAGFLIQYKEVFMQKITVSSKAELIELLRENIAEAGSRCDLSFIDISKLEDLKGVFSSIDVPYEGDLNAWDVSHIKDMSGLFEDSFFNGDISRWDVSHVENMERMFCNSVFSGDISTWDVGSVVNMTAMFSYSKFNGDISGWNVSNVLCMKKMFQCSLFDDDISHWDVSKVKDMSSMFVFSKFKGDLADWDVSSVEDMRQMFAYSCFNGELKRWRPNKLKVLSDMFEGSSYRGERDFFEEIETSCSNENDADSQYQYGKTFKIIYPEKVKHYFYDEKTKKQPALSLRIKKKPSPVTVYSKYTLGSVIDDTIEKYGPCCDLNFIRLRGITDLSYLFCEGDRGRAGFCGDISGWDVSGVKNMEGMFLRSLFNGDISKWNVSKVFSAN